MITPQNDFWKVFKETNGALSSAESLAIMNIAAQAPEGIAMEMGVHKGKSLISSIYGLNYDRTFVLVEPEFKDIDWYDKVKELADSIEINTNSYICEADYSINVIPQYDNYAWVFSDAGSHSDDLPMQEVKMLEDRIISGGIIAFHDVFSQFVKQTEAYEYLLSTGKFEKIEINWQEIFDYVAEHNLEEGNNSWHLYPELPHPPNFVGALRRK